MVGLPGPSPTASNNPGLSPFGAAGNAFPVTSNGPTLPQTSPASAAATQQQQQAFNDVLKSRLAPSPSFGLPNQQQPTPQQQQQQHQVNNHVTRLPSSTPTDLPPTTGPKSVNSSRGPSPTTPIVASPAASLGKGMSSSERAALNASSARPSTMSSQFAAVLAASEREDDSPPPSNGVVVKGKLDNMSMKLEDGCDVKQEDGESRTQYESGKGIKAEMADVKAEPMDEGMDCKQEPVVKEEPKTPDGGADIKPLAQPAGMEGMPPTKMRCSKFTVYCPL